MSTMALWRSWLWRGRHFLIFVGSLITALGALLILKGLAMGGKVDDHLRWLAFLFELAGVLLVIIAVDNARNAFGKPRILATAAGWLLEPRRILWRNNSVSSLSVSPASASLAVEAGSVRVLAHGQSVDEQLRWLRRQVDELYQEIDRSAVEARTQNHLLRVSLDKEIRERIGADDNLREKLEDSMVGDFGVEVLGALYLIVGLALSNLTVELAGLAHWVWARF